MRAWGTRKDVSNPPFATAAKDGAPAKQKPQNLAKTAKRYKKGAATNT